MNELRDQIERLSVHSLGTALGVDLTASADPGRPVDTMIWSSIAIDGGWPGNLRLGCDPALLELGARRMFGRDSKVTTDDTSDVSRELANIMGGNLAPLLGPGCKLSLPENGRSTASQQPMTFRFSAQGARLIIELAANSAPATTQPPYLG